MNKLAQMLMGDAANLDEALDQGAREARRLHAGNRILYHLNTSKLVMEPDFDNLAEYDAFFDIEFKLVHFWSWKHAGWSPAHMPRLFHAVGARVEELPENRYAAAAELLRQAMHPSSSSG